jgi:hypothetical protein
MPRIRMTTPPPEGGGFYPPSSGIGSFNKRIWPDAENVSRPMPPPRIRDFHVSMVLRSDQPASRTLFAMLVRASFDGLTLPTAMNPYCRTSFVVSKKLFANLLHRLRVQIESCFGGAFDQPIEVVRVEPFTTAFTAFVGVSLQKFQTKQTKFTAAACSLSRATCLSFPRNRKVICMPYLFNLNP